MATLADDIAKLKAALDADAALAPQVAAAQLALAQAKDLVNSHATPEVPFALGDGRVVVKLASGLFIGAPADPSTVPIP